MMAPIASFALEHVVVLVTGAIIVVAGLVVRSYGRRHERQTRARGRGLIG